MRPVLWRRKACTRKAGRYRSGSRSAGWTVAVVAVFGAGWTAAESPPVASLKQRVTAFWEARLQGDDITAYQYEIFAHTGEMTVTQYVQARSPALKYMAYTIDTIQEQEQEAQVTVNVQSRLDMPGMPEVPLASIVRETWVRLDDGQWYRNFQPEKPARQKG